MKSDFPEGIADLLTKAPTTTKKEKQVKKTTTTTKETTVPTTPTAVITVTDNTDALINEALVAIGNEIVAGIAHEEALRSACFAVHTATSNGVSVRALESASATVIGRKVSKTTIARYAKVGEALVAKPELVASEVLSAIYAEENAKAKEAKEAKAKASKASASTEGDEVSAEGDDEVVDSIPVDMGFIVDTLVDAPIPGLKEVSAHLYLTDSDDYEVCLAVAQGALLAGANLSGDDEVADALRVLAEAVAKIAKK